MGDMAAERTEEVERSFEVPDGAILPSLTGAAPGLVMGQASELALDAVYFDTADLALARRGVTLRRRTGGDDAGWHVRLPVSTDVRTDLRWPLGARSASVPKSVPKSVQAPVRAWVRNRPLVPIATVTTRRLRRPISDETGGLLGVLCDDEVSSVRLVGDRLEQRWREWQVGLAAGGPHDGPALLDLVATHLRDAGAEASPGASTLRRALADLAPDPPRGVVVHRDSTIEQVLVGRLLDLASHLHEHDRRLRADEADTVHGMRVAARRIRSALQTFTPLLERDRSDRLVGELRWLGQVLAGARDAEVLGRRLADQVAEQPAELVLGPVAARIRTDLRANERTARAAAVAALDDERYFALLDELDAFAEAPPFVADRDEPAASRLPDLVGRDAKRLRRAVAEVGADEEPHARAASLHEARKKAKRLRYGAEVAVPVLGKKARRLARGAKRVQRALGRHQDATVAREYLREQGVRAHLDGENGFTFGRLHALQDAEAQRAEDDFWREWDDLPVRRVRRRLARR